MKIMYPFMILQGKSRGRRTQQITLIAKTYDADDVLRVDILLSILYMAGAKNEKQTHA